jgi:sterol desaturase/sphingolipid hydroxylase (fatty acid hydroxylase superfamily)
MDFRKAYVMIFFQDYIHTVIHKFFHEVSFIRKYHLKHHENVKPTISDAFDAHIIDALGSVIFPIHLNIVLHEPNKSTVIAFGAIYAFWLIYIHSQPNTPFEKWIDKNLYKIGLVSPSFHRKHHTHLKENMSHVFTIFS